MMRSAVLLMGPTASGKTDVAISLCKRFPCDIISVDSALVYRGMDVGTAKPDARTLKRTPHRLIDIRDPEDSYSAGEFVRDAYREMNDVFAAGRIPLLVGGTMMYFRALTEGIADLPPADASIRAEIDAAALRLGWPAMHVLLQQADPVAAQRINPNDSQRIQRALEVYRISGKSLSDWHKEAADAVPEPDIEFVKIALQTSSRSALHQRIEKRLNLMLNNGFVEEVRILQKRSGLHRDSSSMRAVGYRQFWPHVAGECSLADALEKALAATRQLAKRQLTWLRSESSVTSFDPLEAGAIDAISVHLAKKLS
jgi:tRNA dimethylallyltransferase